MNAYWNHLNDRERWMLGIGGVCCLLFLIYLLLYAPLVASVNEKSAQLNEKKSILVWMEHARKQHHSANVRQTLSDNKLLTVFADQLKLTSFQSFSYQLQQTSSGDVQLSFENVPYNAFIHWLWSLSEHYVFSIKQFNTERTQTPGVVKISLIIH